MTKSNVDKVSYNVLGAAIEVQKHLGPGLLESAYHKCLEREMILRKIAFQSNLAVSLVYKGIEAESKLRCDFFVEDCLVVELKATDALTPIHDAQLLTYMRLLRAPKGLLINFNSTNIFYGGQKTMVNHLYRILPDVA